MFDRVPEGPLSTSDQDDEQWQMFVNLERREAIWYPIKIGEDGILDMDTLKREQLAARTAFCELMLPAEFRAFPKSKSVAGFRHLSKLMQAPGLIRRLTAIRLVYKANPTFTRPRGNSRGFLDLPDVVLVRIVDYLPAATTLLFASLSSLCLNIAIYRVEKILWPDHLGRWANNEIRFFDVCIGGEVERSSKTQQDNKTAGHRRMPRLPEYDRYKSLEIPRGVYTDQDEPQVLETLFHVMRLGRAGGVPVQLSQFAAYAFRNQEAYLSFHPDLRYFFQDSNIGSFVEIDIKQCLSLEEPADEKSNDTPQDVFHTYSWIFNSHRIFGSTHWAGRKVRLCPLNFETRSILSDSIDSWQQRAAIKKDLTTGQDVQELTRHGLEELAQGDTAIAKGVEDIMIRPADPLATKRPGVFGRAGTRGHRAAIVREVLRLLGHRWNRYLRWMVAFGVHFYLLTLIFTNAWSEFMRTIWIMASRSEQNVQTYTTTLQSTPPFYLTSAKQPAILLARPPARYHTHSEALCHPHLLTKAFDDAKHL
ncbi:hypothetical protein TWF696_009437 [Orbilia brochopaga]|uniref:F-box domain-containing protein n=1 Tax=Orbilia brochopaga TaxID=3140254 RepID=A0AAV9UBA9_9PEZI